MPTWPNQPAEVYLAQLTDPDPRARQRGAAALAGLRDPRAIAPLIALLANDADADVRAGAAQALGKLGDVQAVGPLIAALRDAAEGVRQRAVVALETLGDPSAAPAIYPLIDDFAVRYDATRAAARLGGADAVEPLMRALRNPPPSLDKPEMGDPSVSGALAIIGEPARAPLLDLLRDQDGAMRARAAQSLYGLRDDQTLSALIAALRDPDPTVVIVARSTIETILNGIKYAGEIERLEAAQTAQDQRSPQPGMRHRSPKRPKSTPAPIFDWPGLMTQWNAELVADDEIRGLLPPEVVASGWLGYPGATEEQLAALETRLGAALPPSYRAFLVYSNGWRETGHFIPAIWSTEEIEWFAVRNQDTIDAWIDGERYDGSEPVPISDEEYLDYGEDGASASAFRSEYLKSALEISDRETAGTAVYLLNPQIVTPEGEWEGWFFAHWIPGAERYRSFWELMVASHASYLYMRDHRQR